jgi:hypothetical protein
VSRFLAVSFSYPTVVLTVLLCVAVVVWLLSLLGLGLDDADLEGGAADGGLGGALAFLHLDGAPVTITLTLWTLFSWFACFTATSLTGLSSPDGAAEVALATGCSGCRWPPAWSRQALLARGLGKGVRRLALTGGAAGAGVVGRSCRITTRTVSDRFGQSRVTLADGTTDTIQVRSAQPTAALTYDSVALVIDFDAADRSYLVEPAPAFLGGNAEQSG